MTAAAEQTVVVGIDGSDAALGAARWAAEFAARHGLALTLVHAIAKPDWHFLTAPPAAAADRVARADAALAAAEAAVRQAHPDLAVRTAAVHGAVAAVLADAAESARLLVIGTGAADHRALGGHAGKIVHRSPCSVVVWRPPLARRTGKPLPIIVGVDESDASDRALAEAFEAAAVLHAALTVVHMWDIGAAVGMGDLGGSGNMDWQLLEMLQSQQRQRMDESVAPLAREYRNVRVDKEFRDISPAKGLTDLSREAQLVVVGIHGRGRIADSILGSVSQNLIHHAECPVLVAR